MRFLRLTFPSWGLILFLLIPAGIFAQTTWYDQGKAATDNNRKVEYYTKSLEAEGENVYTYFYRGWALYGLGKYERALKDFTKVEALGGNLQKQYIYMALGWTYYSLEKYPEALDNAEKAAASKQDFAEAHNLKGWCLIMQDNYLSAVSAFDRLIALEPDNVKGYSSRSYAHVLLGNYSKVLEDCDKALAISPNQENIVERKALALLKLNRTDEGLALVKEKINYKSDDPRSLSNIAEIFYNNDDYKTSVEYNTQAIKLYDKKCQLDREYIKIYRDDIYNIYMARGHAYNAMEDKQRALADYKHATTINPNNHRAWHEIGELQTFQKNWFEGAQGYERAFAIKPDLPYGWVNLGFCYDNLKQPEKAIDAYTRGIKNNPEVGLLYNNRGFGYLEMKRYDEAYADLLKAIEVEPHIVMSHVSLGEYFYARKMYDEAIAKLNEAVKMEDGTVSSYTSAYFTRGLCYFDQQQYETAKADFLKTIELTNDHVLAHEKLGITYYNLGDQCSSYKTLKKTLALESNVAEKQAKDAPKWLGKMTINPCSK